MQVPAPEPYPNCTARRGFVYNPPHLHRRERGPDQRRRRPVGHHVQRDAPRRGPRQRSCAPWPRRRLTPCGPAAWQVCYSHTCQVVERAHCDPQVASATKRFTAGISLHHRAGESSGHSATVVSATGSASLYTFTRFANRTGLCEVREGLALQQARIADALHQVAVQRPDGLGQLQQPGLVVRLRPGLQKIFVVLPWEHYKRLFANYK